MGEAQGPRIIDYGESTYKRDFWVKERQYEDLAERFALRRLLPPRGARILDIGAGFGRLAPLYQGYDEAVLLDYSDDQLREARRDWGDARFRYAAANWYSLPFADGAFDAVVSVRVLHHAEDLPALMREIARVLAPGGVYVLEFANKRNLKAILRFALRRQSWNPFAPEPVEYYPMHWDFHPKWMRGLLGGLGLTIEHTLTVSHFRAGFLKRAVPADLLARADAALQWTGRHFQLTPSVFMRARAAGQPQPAAGRPLYRCPRCAGIPVQAEGGLSCPSCGQLYPIQDGVLMFKPAATAKPKPL